MLIAQVSAQLSASLALSVNPLNSILWPPFSYTIIGGYFRFNHKITALQQKQKVTHFSRRHIMYYEQRSNGLAQIKQRRKHIMFCSNNSCWWIIIILLFVCCGGCGNCGGGCANNDCGGGCGCGNNCGGCGCWFPYGKGSSIGAPDFFVKNKQGGVLYIVQNYLNIIW